MRIAVLIISLCLTMVVGLQSCAVMVGGNVTNDQELSGGGATGLLIAFLFVLGAAFAIGLPHVSMALFAVAALLGFVIGGTTAYSDGTVWGIVSALLAVMSYFGARELRRRKAVQS